MLHGGRTAWAVSLRALALAGDISDADLMLHAQEVAQFGPAAIELYGIAFRGWNSTPYWIEETDDGEGVWMR